MGKYLEIGSVAPDFKLKNSEGKYIKLSDYKGKKIVLYFYPKDNTKGCTKEACDFKENITAIEEKKAVVLGISKDSVESHINFKTKYDLPFEILSDEEKKVIEMYGVWQLKKNYGKEYMGIVRTTYIIDEKGNIKNVYKVNRVNGHVDKVIIGLGKDNMKKIPSFTVNHNKLLSGVYVSRIDNIGKEKITTFDLRFTKPNIEPAMETAPIHAIEHLVATYLRNNEEWAKKIIYFGPMGCRTGFYLIMAGELKSEDIIELLLKTFSFVADFKEEIPGASARDCGNYLDMNIFTAKYHAKKYVKMLKKIDEKRMKYPN